MVKNKIKKKKKNWILFKLLEEFENHICKFYQLAYSKVCNRQEVRGGGGGWCGIVGWLEKISNLIVGVGGD